MNWMMFICGMVWIFTGLLRLTDKRESSDFLRDLLTIFWIMVGICIIYFSK